MKLVSLEKVHEGNYVNRYNATYWNKANGIKIYELISHDKNLTSDKFGNQGKGANQIFTDAVGIIAFNEDMSKVLVQKEFRLACNDWVYNIPGGLIDKGETAEQAATRELKEETGLNVIKILDFLPAAYSAVGFTDETVSTIVCIANGEFADSTSPDEEIEVAWYTKGQVRDMLKTYKMSMRTQTLLYCWANGFSV